MIRQGHERARSGPWRADGLTAYLVPVPGQGPLSAGFVRHCLSVLADEGFRLVVTGALAPEEQRGFFEAGFDLYEELHLLVLDSSVALPRSPRRPRLHRAGPFRKSALLKVDAQAFSSFWRLDKAGLREALGATPATRLRVVLGEGARVVGYALCGTAGAKGFVQRLAVAPAAQGHGLGKRLLLDGLQWLRRSGAVQVAVNTQHGNVAALTLYRQLGFRDEPAGLCVLSAPVGAPRVLA